MSKYTVTCLHLHSLALGQFGKLTAEIQLPAGSTTNYSIPAPVKLEHMSIAELKAYILRDFEMANQD
ncbi:hypothetical protein ACE1YR_17360 [Pseudomonas sp. K1(2024)]|uniref:Uncharacterized protein n=1 Tax=Pseudomonas boreofloridensis TaxID=3064348 RepID=A0ABV4ZCX1_9PSED|nr:hypothetical protein [Pseudomonas sp. K13]MDO7904123.1 hypothetical protein [Pseudomonas sp. K13]